MIENLIPILYSIGIITINKNKMIVSINIDFNSLACHGYFPDPNTMPIDTIALAFYNIVTKERTMVINLERGKELDKDIILQMINMLNDKKPQKIVGWNFEFDYDYIQKRCEIIGLTMELLSLNKISKFDVMTNYHNKKIYGRLHDLAKRYNLEFDAIPFTQIDDRIKYCERLCDIYASLFFIYKEKYT